VTLQKSLLITSNNPREGSTGPARSNDVCPHRGVQEDQPSGKRPNRSLTSVCLSCRVTFDSEFRFQNNQFNITYHIPTPTDDYSTTYVRRVNE